jgi:hypothetical protein
MLFSIEISSNNILLKVKIMFTNFIFLAIKKIQKIKSTHLVGQISFEY